jgi:hypothetical protein
MGFSIFEHFSSQFNSINLTGSYDKLKISQKISHLRSFSKHFGSELSDIIYYNIDCRDAMI